MAEQSACGQSAHPSFDEFVATIAALRAPGGCPWDQAQTHESVAQNLIEESYEAIDAIDAGDAAHLREELGDVLLQVVLQSQIAADAGEFTIDDVCRDINAKIIHRHPHVFGDAKAGSAGDVLKQWEKIKLADKEKEEHPAGLLDSVPKSLPALMEAQKISRKAVAAGFEWETLDDIWAQVEEEIAELKAAYAQCPHEANGSVLRPSTGADAPVDAGSESGCGGDALGEAVRTVELECGDVLFSLVNVARRMGLSAEACLRATDNKFRKRWAFMEQKAEECGKTISDFTTEELEALWQESKTYDSDALNAK